ncbi:hypothetical protein ZWY2020_048090 [Hordeum vulgare]|nr:hypothetical protein ZWY2020_048090 [Hordeum vulgare]
MTSLLPSAAPAAGWLVCRASFSPPRNIRVWHTSTGDPAMHKRVGSLSKLGDSLMRSVRPSHYIKTRRRHNSVWLRHFDVVSCLSLDADVGLLYSGSFSFLSLVG